MRIKRKIKDFIISKKLKGGALYISIIASVFIGVLLTLFIVLSRYNQKTVTDHLLSVQLQLDLHNAMELAKSDYFTQEINNRWLKNSYSEDSIRVNKKSWGAFVLIRSEAKNRHRKISACALYGTYLTADTALLTSDNSRPVGVSGRVLFKANAYLPKAGIKPAYIEGQSYQGNPENSGFIKVAPFQIPSLQASFVKGIKDCYDRKIPAEDSLMSFLPERFQQPFSSRTAAVQINTGRLSHTAVKGNVKLIADDILVDSSAHLEDVLIICNKVRFKSGFHGSVHVIARDSIVSEKKCLFDYPSSFVLSNEEAPGSIMKNVQIDEDCVFSGGIIACNGGDQNQNSCFLKLHAKSEVNGLIYSEGYMHIEGVINGTAICTKLLLKTPSAVYENHLLGCEINPKKYSGIIGVPMIFRNNGSTICCKNL